MNLDIKSLDLIVLPELVAASLKKNEHDLYFCWMVLKAMDARKTDSEGNNIHKGNGLFHTSVVMTVIHGVLGVKEKQLYQKLQDGIGKYWEKPGGKNGRKKTSLIGTRRVIDYLSPTMPRTEPYQIKIEDNWSDSHDSHQRTQLKYLMISMVASRFRDYRPVAAATVAEDTGCCLRTVKTALKCDVVTALIKKQNWHIVDNGNSYKEMAIQYDRIGGFGKGFKIMRFQKNFSIMSQIGNSYALPEYQRLPLGARPREMKPFDLINREQCTAKKKYVKSPNQKYNSKTLCQVGRANHNGEDVRVWCDVNNMHNAENALHSKRNSSPGGLWNLNRQALSEKSMAG